MWQATWKLQLMVLAFVGLSSRTANGDEVAAATTGIIKKISDAFKGGEVGQAAQSQLIGLCGTITFVLAILFFCYIVASAIGRFVGNIVTSKVDVTLGKFLNKAVRNVIMLVVAMVALEKYMGLNVAGFAAILAAAGFAVGMALQGTLGNFAAGVMLLAFRPFKVDDYIAVAGTEGTVEEIDLFTTRLNALDNTHLIIPNGEIFGAKLENYSRNPLRRVDVNVGAAYSADLKVTRSALERAAFQVAHKAAQSARQAQPSQSKTSLAKVISVKANPAKTDQAAANETDESLEVPSPQIYLRELGASSVDWQLRVWCHPGQYWGVREDLTAAAKEALDAAGISIPYPQMDVHVVGKLMAKAA